MAEKAIVVALLAETKQFASEMGKAATEAESFGKRAKAVAHVAGAGLAVGLGLAAHAALDAQVAQSKFDTVVKASHVGLERATSALEKNRKAGADLGFTDDQVTQSYAKLVAATHNTAEANKELTVAENLARFKHIDLATAASMVTKVHAGATRALKEFGIVMPNVVTGSLKLKESYQKTTQAIHDHWQAVSKHLTPAEKDAEAAQLRDAAAAYQLEQQHTKVADKMRQGAQAVDLLSTKVKGQADAYSKTAAGGMEVFKAKSDQLLIQLGQGLLPVIVKVTGVLTTMLSWLDKHKTVLYAVVAAVGAYVVVVEAVSVAQKLWAAGTALVTGAQWALNAAMAANPIGIVVIAIAAIAAALVALYFKSKTVRDAINDVWHTMQAAFHALEEAFHAGVRAIESAWQQWGGTIKRVFDEFFKPIKAYVKTELDLITGVFRIFKDIVTGNWSKLWSDIKSLASRWLSDTWGVIKSTLDLVNKLFAGLPGKILSAVSGFGTLLYSAGRDLINGLLRGIESMAGGLLHKAEGLGHSIKHAFSSAMGIFSPSKVMFDLGTMTVQGLADGIGVSGGKAATAMEKVAGRLVAAVHTGLQRVAAAIKSEQATIDNAFASIMATANSYFDKLANVQPGDTKAGKQLAAMQLADQINQLNQAISQANDQLTKDQSSGADAQTILADQQALADALRAKQEFNLQQQADQQAAAQKKRELAEKSSFDRSLNAIQKSLDKGKITHKKAQEEILALYKKYGLDYEKAGHNIGSSLANSLTRQTNRIVDAAKKMAANEKIQAQLKRYAEDYKKSGVNIGKALAEGMESQVGAVKKAAQDLAQAISDNLKTHSPTKEGPMSDLDHWWDAFAPTILSAIAPGDLVAGVNGLVSGGSRPAVARPSGAFGGDGGGIHVHIHADTVIGSDLERAARDFEPYIRSALLQTMRRNGGTVGIR